MRLAIVVGILSGAAFGQTAFEVASVRPVPGIGYPGSGIMRGGPGTADPGRLAYQHATLKLLLTTAYGVENYQVSGPAWINSERYDIAAKVPAGTTKEQAAVMLQNLLAERFKLELHRESREFQVYELTVAKGGPKLKESTKESTKESARSADAAPIDPAETMRQVTTDKDGLPWLPPGRPNVMNGGGENLMQSARQQPISTLVRFLQQRMSLLGLPVLDKTGLTGTYDYALKFTPPGLAPAAAPPTGNPADAASDPAPDVFEAVQQYLGLKLEQKKDPLDVLVIDRAEKTPTEN
jgi:uncharacterized protein (TIGR03435 family)